MYVSEPESSWYTGKKACVHTKVFPQIFIVTILAINTNWKQFKCVLLEQVQLQNIQKIWPSTAIFSSSTFYYSTIITIF